MASIRLSGVDTFYGVLQMLLDLELADGEFVADGRTLSSGGATA